MVALSGTAGAAWFTIHGHSGHIQNPAIISSDQPVRMWGLDFVPGSNTVNWVHFAVPTPPQTNGVQKIRIYVYCGIDSWVTAVTVYNGPVLVKSFPFINKYGNGWVNLMLNLDAVTKFSYALGVSVRVEGGPDAGIGRFLFSFVGADFN